MALINWDNSFSMNVSIIDIQHQRLISIINELNDAMKEGKGRDVLSKIINGLISYAAVHFGTEERYFDQFGYPEKDNHKKEHEAFVARITGFKEEYEKGKLGLTIEIMNFLANWLSVHIKSTDKKYSQFFVENGLK